LFCHFLAYEKEKLAEVYFTEDRNNMADLAHGTKRYFFTRVRLAIKAETP